LQEGGYAENGPECLAPLDVGNVFMIGAGGVGSCLVYWLRQSGGIGHWTVADGDQVKLHNTNRSLGILPSDAGWPNNQPKYKAQTAAELIGASYYNEWYDDIVEEASHADLILPLANERGIRNKISQKGDAILLHATTSRNWEAQLHRHIAGRDDCIVCRMPENSPNFICSTVELPNNNNGSSNDAALPFLSAAAGFLLLNGLYRLMYGDLIKDRYNWWRMIFNSADRILSAGRRKCTDNCSVLLPKAVRDKINKGKRWAHIG
jgi:molybdopterin/thiamine biosynthesis adenylyltransferase